MTEIGQEPTVPRNPDKWANWKIAVGLMRDPAGHPPFIWAERWNAPILMVLITFGIPLLSLSGFSTVTKLWIGFYWVAFLFLYVLLEAREIMGQMEGRGSISAPQARRQVRTAQLPHIGTILAVVIWLVAWAYYRNEPGGSPIRYGVVEWHLVGVNVFAILITNYFVNGLLMEMLKSAPRGERTEQRLPRNR